MNKHDLIVTLSEDTGLTIKEAEEIVNRIFEEMSNTLAKGERVEIRGFGSFKLKKYKGYKGMNPKTRESIEVKPKKKPYFKCGKDLKERVDTHGESKRRKR